MDYQVKSEFVENLEASCVIVGFFSKRKLTPTAEALDARLHGLLANLLKRDDLSGKPGDVLVIGNTGIEGIERVIAVGFGKKEEVTVASYRKTLATAARAVLGTPAKQVVTALHEVGVKGQDASWTVRQIIEILETSAYKFSELKTDPPVTKSKVSRVNFLVSGKGDSEVLQKGLREGKAIAAGMNIAR